jgi:hypothetical protein
MSVPGTGGERSPGRFGCVEPVEVEAVGDEAAGVDLVALGEA